MLSPPAIASTVQQEYQAEGTAGDSNPSVRPRLPFHFVIGTICLSEQQEGGRVSAVTECRSVTERFPVNIPSVVGEIAEIAPKWASP